MLRCKLHLAIHLATCFAIAGSGAASEPEDVEPPVKYTLIVDGKATEISEGKPVRLAGDFKSPEVSLKLDPNRTFKYAGVKFQYPRHFSFGADLAGNEARLWTLRGNDVNIMVADVEGYATLTVFARSMANNLGKGTVSFVDRKLNGKLGGHNLPGLKVKITIGETESSMEFYMIGKGGGRTRFLVFHDHTATRSKDGDAAFTLLNDSFDITRK